MRIREWRTLSAPSAALLTPERPAREASGPSLGRVVSPVGVIAGGVGPTTTCTIVQKQHCSCRHVKRSLSNITETHLLECCASVCNLATFDLLGVTWHRSWNSTRRPRENRERVCAMRPHLDADLRWRSAGEGRGISSALRSTYAPEPDYSFAADLLQALAAQEEKRWRECCRARPH